MSFGEETPRREIPFLIDHKFQPLDSQQHWEPAIARESRPLIEGALELQQDDYVALAGDNPYHYVKTYGLGPCLLFTAHKRDQQIMGGIHLDAESDIARLFVRMEKELGIVDYEGFRLALYGGIKGMPGSDSLRMRLSAYLSDRDIPISFDRSMMLHWSDYGHAIDENAAALLYYQNLIISRKSGLALSFDMAQT